MKCPNCGKGARVEFRVTRIGQEYICRACGHEWGKEESKQ